MTESDKANPSQSVPEVETTTNPAAPADERDVAPTSTPTKPKVQIGSQRDAAAPASQKPKAVQAAISNPVQLVENDGRVEEPEVEVKSTVGLSDDLESEIDAALSDFSMDSVVDLAAADESELQPNSRVKGTVTRTHGENVFIKLPSQYEGVASLASFKAPPQDGDLIEVVVRSLNAEEGLYDVGIPGSAVDIADWEDLKVGEVVECRVSGSNTGGLEVMVNRIRGFIPASQIDRFRVENFGEYHGQKLQCVVMEVKPPRKLVLSRRAVLDREQEEKRKELLETIEAGQVHEGTVTKLMDFGAFVDLGGIEGLIHVSKLSWDRVTHPKDVVSEGEKVKVKIEKIDKTTGKMSLSRRDTMEHPWHDIMSKYQPNETVSGTVSKLAQFGAFVRLEPGIEGLVHISEVAHHRVMKVSNYVKEGDLVQVKILSIDPESQKMSLSMKATQAAPVKAQSAKEKEPEEVEVRPLAVPKSSAPLKGGTDRKSGGEDIGLNW